MITKLSNYLRTYRKHSGLSQADLAFLFNSKSHATISRHERHGLLPTVDLVFAYEAAFGVPARELFAGVYEDVQRGVSRQAKRLRENLASEDASPEVADKKARLEEIISRTETSLQEARVHGDTRGMRVIALDPTSLGFGFVVFEGPTKLLDWGQAHLRPCTHEKCLEQIGKLFAQYDPHVVVIEDTRSTESRRGARVKKLLNAVAHLAESSGAEVSQVSVSAVKKTFAPRSTINKHEIATLIARAFPELLSRLPPPRKLWTSEAERMGIFDAAAFALTYFRRR